MFYELMFYSGVRTSFVYNLKYFQAMQSTTKHPGCSCGQHVARGQASGATGLGTTAYRLVADGTSVRSSAL